MKFYKTLEVPVSSRELHDWHMRDGAFDRLVAPWDDVREIRADPVANGAKRIFDVKKGGVWIRWVADHVDVVDGESFTDVQEKGPFSEWRHTHRFDDLGPNRSRLVDDIEFALPAGALGEAVAGGSVMDDIERMFTYRHRTTLADLEFHSSLGGERKTIGVTGASGLIGKQLCALLTTGGHRVVRFVRKKDQPADDEIRWSTDGVVDVDRMEELDAVIHLAGESVAQRWTTESKRRILESRTKGTAAIVDAIRQSESKPEAFICASAVGFYGDTGASVVDETADPGDDFLAQVCKEWEAEAAKASDYCRVVIGRIGVVLDPRGGALRKLLPVFLGGAGGPVGSGDQLMSWVGIDDVITAFATAVQDETMEGAFNFVGTEPVRQETFARVLAEVVHRPALIPTPAFAIKTMFGEMGKATVLASTGVRPKRLRDHGFRFRAETLEEALRHCLGRDAEDPGMLRPETKLSA